MLVRMQIFGKWYGKSFKNSLEFTWYLVNKNIEKIKIIKLSEGYYDYEIA